MSKISFFRAPASSIVPYKDISLVDIYHYITGPYAKARTEQLRRMLHSPLALSDSDLGKGCRVSGGKGAAAFKRTKFDYVTFSGTFTRRTDADLVAHSGYLCLDFDHLDDAGNLTAARSVLLQDPHFETLLLFTSPSGNGLKWVIEIGAADSPLPLVSGASDLGWRNALNGRFEETGCPKGEIGAVHRTWFNAVRNYLATTYHLDADPACVNVSRSCFLPHDPDCYIAPRLLPELAPTIAEHPAVEDLMVSLGATNIDVKSINE